MILRRVRVWGVKDGRRVFVEQQGPVLLLDPEVQVIREAEDIEAAASDYLDTVIDVWTGQWASDAELEQIAKKRYIEADDRDNQVYDVATMRAMEAEEFDRRNIGPPPTWARIVDALAKQDQWLKKRQRYGTLSEPEETLLCRECLRPSRWIWYECFPFPTCGSAGWVAICEDCQSWHRELTCIES